jgi:hypothetical protein
MAGSKNNPDNRQGAQVQEKWVMVVDNGKKRLCRVDGNKLVDKNGNFVCSY